MTTGDDLLRWAGGLMSEGEVVLREVRDEDVPTLTAWWNSPDIALRQRPDVFPLAPGLMRGMFDRWNGTGDGTAAAFAITRTDGELVGHLGLWGLSVPARICTLGILIGGPHQGRGLGRSAMLVGLRVAFTELGANKVELHVYAHNDRARRLYRSLGFQEEGTRRATTFHAGRFHDEVLMGMLAAEHAVLHDPA